MNMILNTRARGLVGVRADSGSATKILAELQQTFEAFKEANEKELAGIKANFADVVQTEKVDRINAEITKLQKALDDTNAMLAAVKVGAGGGDEINPAVAEHSKAFNKWFRKGDRAVDADMRDLEVKASLSTLTTTRMLNIITATGSGADLTTINGAQIGMVIAIMAPNGYTEPITIKDGTGNLQTIGSADVVINTSTAVVQFACRNTTGSSAWVQAGALAAA